VWRIYYTDGETLDGERNPPPDVRDDDVALIAEHRDGRTLLHQGGDYYRCTEGRWRCRSTQQDGDLYGRLMSNEDFEAVKVEALKWLGVFDG
jgi:hypothetical protein